MRISTQSATEACSASQALFPYLRPVLLATALFSALSCTSEPATKVVQGTAVEHGEALFHDSSLSKSSLNKYSCATCHEATSGEAGQTILPGASLAGVLKRPSYWGGQELDLLPAINHCLYYFMLKDDQWTADDSDARAMYAYLESLPDDGGAAQAAPFTTVYTIADAPDGDAKKGEAIFGRACVSCHGPAHTGMGRLVQRAPVLPEQTLDEHPLDKYTAQDRRLVFIEKIRHGGFIGYGGQMPPFSSEKLSEQDLSDLLAFFGLPSQE
jgi:thiosulfate dehydrogenase